MFNTSHTYTTSVSVTYLYKAVGKDYISPRGTSYRPGTIPSCDDFVPNDQCGNGLHFCKSPKESRTFVVHHVASKHRVKAKDVRYLCCPVLTSEIVTVYSGNKYKVPRCILPIWEVDINGNPINRDRTGRVNKKIRSINRNYLPEIFKRY